MTVLNTVFFGVQKILKEDRKAITTLIFYGLIEAVLALSIPLASVYVINSILSHAQISVFVLGFIIMVLFVVITLLQILQSYIIEKFQQKIFLTTAIDISLAATDPFPLPTTEKKETVFIMHMNYFFDITAIQKFFPILMLDGVGVVIKIVVSLLLLWFFDPVLSIAGIFFFAIYITLLLVLGKHSTERAVNRSDAKHKVIFFLQHMFEEHTTRENVLEVLDKKLSTYALSRQDLFEIIIRQQALTYIAEGIVFVGFMIIGSYLVFDGHLPVGEFIAAEFIVVSIIYALKGFVKQFDYIYDTIEGFHKINKLTHKLGEAK